MDTKQKVDRFIEETRSVVDDKGSNTGLPPGTLPFVTISSQSGAGGNRLTQALAEMLENDTSGNAALKDWRIFDKNMCQLVLKEEHLAESMNDLLHEEYHSQIHEFVMGLYGDHGMQNVAYARLARLLRTIASVGKVIIQGHGGCMATSALAGGTHLRLVAPLQDRAARMASVLQLSEEEASRKILRRDKDQQNLFKTHYRLDSADPELYDMVCNTGRMSIDTVAEFTMSLIHKQID
ncbi:MAG: cytidylate kinase-like family protein [Granulosicoccus sp.]|nr:cytidylate kinase-like family protein [Granulosicoccus sp.]